MLEKKIPWHLRDFTYKMIKCGLIEDDFLDWGKPFTKGTISIEREKDLTTGNRGKGVFVKACHKSLSHNIPKLLEVPSYPIKYRPIPITIDPDLSRRMQLKYSKGPVNDEKHKPTTNQALLDESNEHTKTREK